MATATRAHLIPKRLSRGLVAATLAALLVMVSGAPLSFAAATSTPPLKVGISYGGRLSGMSAATLKATFDDAVRLGVTWVRDDLSWANVEATRGTYDWAPFDAVVASANAHGLSVVPILDFTPAWSRPAGCSSQACAPSDPTAFAAFARAAARRYASKSVRTWEIWNEPNVVSFWQPSPDAVAYGRLLVAASTAIKSVDGRATVVSGGLAPTATALGVGGSGRGGLGRRPSLLLSCAAVGDRGLERLRPDEQDPSQHPVRPERLRGGLEDTLGHRIRGAHGRPGGAVDLARPQSDLESRSRG
jgi:hypothetical protein